MDIMLILQIIVLLGGIYLGVRLGGMGVGYAGGLGVVILAMLGMKVDMKDIPMDVILIIASVISAITAMQVAGGLDYLVQVASKILRKNPKQINYLAPIVTYLLTILAGTGHTAFSMIPVIVEVAKTQNIKPSAPLALSVVSSQVAITASPISAAFVAMTGVCEPLGVSYPMLLFICISTTFVAMIVTAFIVNKFYDLDLSKDPIYQDRLARGAVAEIKEVEYQALKPYAKRSVAIFAIGVLVVVCYALVISKSLGIVAKPILSRDAAIISFMLTIGFLIATLCKIDTSKLLSTSTFQSGMNACICVIGIAWLGTTFVAMIVTAFIVNKFYDLDLSKDPIYQDRLARGAVAEIKEVEYQALKPYAKRSVAIFAVGVLVVVCYALVISKSLGIVAKPILSRDAAIISFMLTIGFLIATLCKVDTSKLLSTSTFQSGMNACICVIGIAWLGTTFVNGHIDSIKEVAKNVVTQYPFILAVALYFLSCLLYSQAATTRVMMPAVAAALGMTTPENSGQIWILVASFAAVSGLFVLPTYPTTLGAIAMDDTGTTRVGKFVFNHSFFVPGTIMVALSVVLAFLIAPVLL